MDRRWSGRRRGLEADSQVLQWPAARCSRWEIGDRILTSSPWIRPMAITSGRRKCPSPFPDSTAGYASIVVAEVGGIRHYVQLTAGGVVGVSASDGKLLWSYDRLGNNTANIPTPIVLKDKVFCSAGYGKGGAL